MDDVLAAKNVQQYYNAAARARCSEVDTKLPLYLTALCGRTTVCLGLVREEHQGILLAEVRRRSLTRSSFWTAFLRRYARLDLSMPTEREYGLWDDEGPSDSYRSEPLAYRARALDFLHENYVTLPSELVAAVPLGEFDCVHFGVIREAPAPFGDSLERHKELAGRRRGRRVRQLRAACTTRFVVPDLTLPPFGRPCASAVFSAPMRVCTLDPASGMFVMHELVRRGGGMTADELDHWNQRACHMAGFRLAMGNPKGALTELDLGVSPQQQEVGAMRSLLTHYYTSHPIGTSPPWVAALFGGLDGSDDIYAL